MFLVDAGAEWILVGGSHHKVSGSSLPSTVREEKQKYGMCLFVF